MLANFTIPNGVILLRSLAAQASLPACRASAAGGQAADHRIPQGQSQQAFGHLAIAFPISSPFRPILKGPSWPR